MKFATFTSFLFVFLTLALPACDVVNRKAKAETEGETGEHHSEQRIVATSPLSKDVVITQQYVCQIHSKRHIDVRALENGYLEAIPIKEGQKVKTGEVMFQIVPILFQAKLDAEMAEVQLAQMKMNYTSQLAKDNVVSQSEVALLQAELSKAQAKLKLAQAEFNFATVKAPFDGLVDRLQQMQGSLIKEGDVLTTLSDNSTMWVYFNVTEARYLEYMATPAVEKENQHIELLLANGNKFPQTGKIAAIEGQFNNETGNIPFRADFANPDGLLRHGQTGNVLINRTIHDAIVIPQRATFEILDKMYVFVVGEDHVIHQRLITIQYEKDDIFIIKSGLGVKDKIVLGRGPAGARGRCRGGLRLPQTGRGARQHEAPR